MENMFKTKSIIKWTIFLCCCVMLIFYGVYNISKRNTEKLVSTESANYLINTPGCAIPDYSKSFKHTLNPVRSSKGCDRRTIFIRKISDYKIQFIIDKNFLKILERHKPQYSCYYQYALRSTKVGEQDKALKYTESKGFKNGTISSLEHEVISVQCSLANSSKPIYKDAYMFVKKKVKPLNSSGLKWNVLIIGMDTMSRSRVYQSMPNVVKYLRDENWLDFRAYQKVGLNTFPNLMAGLGGLTSSSSFKQRNNTIDFFRQNLIWNQYSHSGYATAYGEDHLKCPDTFSRYGFSIPPTDHYMRPLFLVGEKTQGRHVLCTGHLPSGVHILNYAAEFIDSYKQNNHFGFFWINSYSHNLDEEPALFDDAVKTFFINLKKSGLLKKTFVIFYSDHGIRFGKDKVKAESFYDERLPMFFMRIPDLYNKKHPEDVQNAITNQYRLVTTYDFYLTLWAILAKSDHNLEKKSLDFCPSCSSVFESKPLTRNCADASGEEAMPWCACCHLEEINKEDLIAITLSKIVTHDVNNRTLEVETVKCTKCIPLTFHQLLRIHKCFDKSTGLTKYVVAISMYPNELMYEAIISQENMKVVALDTIGAYNAHSSCVKSGKHLRPYCDCETLKHCK